MRKILPLLVLVFLAGSTKAQQGNFPASTSGGVPITTVSALNSIPGKTKGTLAVVTDGSTATDCVTGGGANTVVCQYNGTVWAQVVAASSGSTAFSAITGGTNTASLVMGTGGSLSTSGSGTITATGLGGTPALPNGTTATTQSQLDGSSKLSTTSYVDTAVSNAIAGVNPAVAVLAATIGSNLTGTYSNGVGGIGATFTITATGAFTLDGAPINAIGQRILLKDQSSAFQNGVYTATVVGTTGISPVFTRALDYDTPSDINSTGAIPVQSGTVNATTSWLLTSTVNTVGTDALTYTQFSIAPTKIAQTIWTGTFTLGTSAIASGACATVVTASATGVATTDTLSVGFNGDPTAITGYGVSATGAVLTIYPYPTSNNVNVKVCNSTANSITPGSMTLNGRVSR